LFELSDLIYDLGINPTYEQLDLLYEEFRRDFIDNILTVNGLNLKVVLRNSNISGFEAYPETFVHLITRKGQSNKRIFDRHRANKIHWVRCILENRTEEDITYFQYPEENNKMRDYYWYKEEGFIVIMEKVTPDYLVITSFHIDNKRNEEHFSKRCQWYLDNKA